MSSLSVAAGIYGAASVVTALCFALDKRRAVGGGRRLPESRLHLLELCGGWPGALLAMALVRHKRRKPAYWSVTLAIALAHLLAWAWVWRLRAS